VILIEQEVVLPHHLVVLLIGWIMVHTMLYRLLVVAKVRLNNQ
jgi:hypothetical protein